MIQLYVGFKVVDENGFIVDSVTFQEGEEFEIQPNWISELVPNFYKPKWDFEQKKWVEGATQEEIDEIEKQQPNPNGIDLLKQENEELKQRLTIAESAVIALMDFM